MLKRSDDGPLKTRSWTDEEVKIKAMSWIDDWNSRDLDRIMSHYAPNARFEASTVVTRWDRPDGVLRGKDELRVQFRLGLSLAPNLHFTLEEIFFAPGGYAVVYRRENGNRVIDTVKLDEHGDAYDVTAYYLAKQK